ncbi:MAG TPA: hypothetical protein PKX94_02635 [Opitutales bacterium]|nr:hypothetical protein [Opitutales bacterium]
MGGRKESATPQSYRGSRMVVKTKANPTSTFNMFISAKNQTVIGDKVKTLSNSIGFHVQMQAKTGSQGFLHLAGQNHQSLVKL